VVAGDLIRKEKRMRASNDNSRAMPSHSIWLFAVAWVLLGLNTIYLAERAYDMWQIPNNPSFAWIMVMTVVIGQFAVGLGSYIGTVWARQGRTFDAALAWCGAIAGVMAAFSAAFTDLGRWTIYPLAFSINVMGPVMAVVFLRWTNEMTEEKK
jgi:hypothetical protein